MHVVMIVHRNSCVCVCVCVDEEERFADIFFLVCEFINLVAVRVTNIV